MIRLITYKSGTSLIRGHVFEQVVPDTLVSNKLNLLRDFTFCVANPRFLSCHLVLLR